MENLHLKNLDMNKILKNLKPKNDYIDEDDDDFEYDDYDDEWEWTEEDEEEFKKYRRRERILTTLPNNLVPYSSLDRTYCTLRKENQWKIYI